MNDSIYLLNPPVGRLIEEFEEVHLRFPAHYQTDQFVRWLVWLREFTSATSRRVVLYVRMDGRNMAFVFIPGAAHLYMYPEKAPGVATSDARAFGLGSLDQLYRIYTGHDAPCPAINEDLQSD